MAGARDVFRRGAEFHGDGGFRDHRLGVGPENVDAEHAIGFGVGQDFDEAFGREVGARTGNNY